MRLRRGADRSRSKNLLELGDGNESSKTSERFELNLPDTFARDAVDFAELLECHGRSPVEPEALDEDDLLAFREATQLRPQDVLAFLTDRGVERILGFRTLVVAQRRPLLFAHG